MITLSIFDTALALVPLILVFAVYWYLNQNTKDLAIASARMVLQLVMIGYALTFLFSYERSWIGLLVLTFMLCAATAIVLRPVKDKHYRRYLRVFACLAIAASLILWWVVKMVINLDPWYQPNYVIPIAGMICANGMTGLSICAERFEKEISRGESLFEARSQAFNAALIPQTNAFLAVGLVSLPGMMTGQILSGISPLVAVRYQIMVMSMVMATTCIAVALYLWFEAKSTENKTLAQKEISSR